MTEVWWAPRDIRYQRDQVIWLIEFVLPLPEGEWPPDPKQTGYHGGDHLSAQRAPYVAPCDVMGDLDLRIKRTGNAGATLVWEIQHGWNDYWVLSPQAKMALNYMSCWPIRKQSFFKWCWYQREKHRDK